jgi:hypothetical protein
MSDIAATPITRPVTAAKTIACVVPQCADNPEIAVFLGMTVAMEGCGCAAHRINGHRAAVKAFAGQPSRLIHQSLQCPRRPE